MKKKNIAAISITLLIILITAGCGSNKNVGIGTGMTDESVSEEKSDVNRKSLKN
ncbi:hypothetical protein [Butyrivibrio sp. M55]|uniref:hypothetical protein n=1 Tax=Butyrivibrio sp. M55 TaxID=1855323 RepID=UPI0015873E12|nr:hypothetical protein [Butyrivibrio sp. M55]